MTIQSCVTSGKWSCAVPLPGWELSTSFYFQLTKLTPLSRGTESTLHASLMLLIRTQSCHTICVCRITCSHYTCNSGSVPMVPPQPTCGSSTAYANSALLKLLASLYVQVVLLHLHKLVPQESLSGVQNIGLQMHSSATYRKMLHALILGCALHFSHEA